MLNQLELKQLCEEISNPNNWKWRRKKGLTKKTIDFEQTIKIDEILIKLEKEVTKEAKSQSFFIQFYLLSISNNNNFPTEKTHQEFCESLRRLFLRHPVHRIEQTSEPTTTAQITKKPKKAGFLKKLFGLVTIAATLSGTATAQQKYENPPKEVQVINAPPRSEIKYELDGVQGKTIDQHREVVLKLAQRCYTTGFEDAAAITNSGRVISISENAQRIIREDGSSSDRVYLDKNKLREIGRKINKGFTEYHCHPGTELMSWSMPSPSDYKSHFNMTDYYIYQDYKNYLQKSKEVSSRVIILLPSKKIKIIDYRVNPEIYFLMQKEYLKDIKVDLTNEKIVMKPEFTNTWINMNDRNSTIIKAFEDYFNLLIKQQFVYFDGVKKVKFSESEILQTLQLLKQKKPNIDIEELFIKIVISRLNQEGFQSSALKVKDVTSEIFDQQPYVK